MESFEEYLVKAGIIKELGWTKGRFPEEPNEFYIPAPERKNGVKLAGCMIDEAYHRIIQEFLDKYTERYRGWADVVRSAVIHYCDEIIVPGMLGPAKHRARGFKMMARLKAQRHETENDTQMFKDCEGLFSSAKAEFERREPLEALHVYIGGILLPERQEDLIERAEAHPVFGPAFTEYRAKVKAKPLEGQEPYLDEVG